MKSKTKTHRVSNKAKVFTTSHSCMLRSLSQAQTSTSVNRTTSNSGSAPSPTKPALWHFDEVEIIETLLQVAHMKQVREKYNLPEGSKISEYLETRGLSYLDFRLIQYMAGATLQKIQPIIAYRRANPLPQLEKKWAPFIQHTDAILHQDYNELFKRLSTETRNSHTQSYFRKVRFISALYFTYNLQEAANILEVDIEEVKQFISLEPVSISLKTHLNMHSIFTAEITDSSEACSQADRDEIAILSHVGLFSFPPSRPTSPAWILHPNSDGAHLLNALEGIFMQEENETPRHPR